jgi:hypothetical protein
VLHNGQLSEPFTAISGVRQGCLLSRLLFLVVLDGVLNETFHGKAQGILWKLTQTLDDLDYIDEVCLLSHKYDHMQSKLTDLHNIFHKVGLEINYSKTEEIQINTKLNKAITLENRDIKRVSNFTYLGSNVSENGSTAKDIDIRIQKARGAFSRLRRIWQSTFIHKDMKIKSLMHVSNPFYCMDDNVVGYKLYPKKTSILCQPTSALHSKDMVSKNYLQ